MLRKAYLEITNVCNLSCSFCPGTRRKPHFLSVEEFRTLSEKLKPHTEYLYFHLMGEPLLHPELEQFLLLAGEQGFRVILTSNGTLLPERGDMLLKAQALHKVNLSLQSFEGNQGREPEEYIQTCAAFARAAGAQGKICVLRLWNRGGMDSLNERIRGILLSVFPGEWRKGRGGFQLAERVWMEPGDRFAWPDSKLPEIGESCFCYGLRDQVGVLCDGTVVPCCLDHEGDIPLGNLFQQNLDEILASERARTIYQGFSRRQAVEALCRRCGYARRFNTVSR